MSKMSYLIRKTTNECLDLISDCYSQNKNLPNDSALSKILGVSRTTVRNVLKELHTEGIIQINKSSKRILIEPKQQNYFDLSDAPSSKEVLIEKYFLSLIHSRKLLPGDKFSELDLAKKSHCNTITVREFMIRFAHTGLIEKKPRAQWQMVEFDEAFAKELSEFRRILEINALKKLMLKTEQQNIQSKFTTLLEEHEKLQKNPDMFLMLPPLDRKLHLSIQDGAENRFVRQFFNIVSFVCHYHYQWDKADEQARNLHAVDEHIDLIKKILSGDGVGAMTSLNNHLDTGRITLLRSAHGLSE